MEFGIDPQNSKPINLCRIPMMLISTVSGSSLRWSNQLCRLFFSAPHLPGLGNFRLLQFLQMDSCGSAAKSHVLPCAPFCSCNGVYEKYSHSRDHNSDAIMVGSIRVFLKRMGREQSSSLSCDRKCDHFELGIVQKETSAKEPNPDHQEFSPPSEHGKNRSTVMDTTSERGLEINSGQSRSNESAQRCESYLPNQFGKENKLFHYRKRQFGDISSEYSPFNICRFQRRGKEKSQAFWRVKGCGSEEIMEHVAEASAKVLRPGMVLLKHYITLQKQVNIVKTCQKLGLGPGGFCRPGYKGGPKLRLQMMCLGLNWDPETRKYEDKRAVDGAKPPDIPLEFAELVKKALKDAHNLIKKETDTNDVEGILPSMSPDICIVNFYTTSGRLGLHQDRDESKQSLVRGLPVVSFSVGNSAEFLYGDQRDVDHAENVLLESGDVLIFGGESRHLYHGVSSIIPNSAPKRLLDHTGLRPGRLNLTFREY